MIIVFLTFIGMGVKVSKWGKNSLVGVKILQVGPNEAVKCVGSNVWHLQFKFCVSVCLRLRFTWPWKDEQKYRLIFLLVFAVFPLVLQEFENNDSFTFYTCKQQINMTKWWCHYMALRNSRLGLMIIPPACKHKCNQVAFCLFIVDSRALLRHAATYSWDVLNG